MSNGLLRVAVVGHTNTGKTSLLRTLMRDVQFGEVSDRPAVTRVVEGAVLRADGRPVMELFDTPGLEDSIALLEHLDALNAQRDDRRLDAIDIVNDFLSGPEARGRFAQEAKALTQLLACDVALYVVDARDRVMAKHRDELEILGRCARPVVPVLNFTANDEARTVAWREHLARVNMHAVAEFDTVVFDDDDERRLFEKVRTLVDRHAPAINALIEDRARQRRTLLRASAMLLAELAVDVAAHAVTVPAKMDDAAEAAMEQLRQSVRDREQQCVDALLALHRFRPDDVAASNLPIDEGRWGMDLFSPEAVKHFGVHAGSAAATGAMVGLTLDVMFAGLSLGTGAATGAAIGGLVGAGKTHGRRLLDRVRGRTELRCHEATVQVLVARQLGLVTALRRRGHASVTVIQLDDASSKSPPRDGTPASRTPAVSRRVMTLLARTRAHPEWSGIPTPSTGDKGSPSPATPEPPRRPLDDPDRQETIDRLADELIAKLTP